MFAIDLYDSPLGPDQTPTLQHKAWRTASERADAVKIVEEWIAEHDRYGYDGRQDTWWCRNDGDTKVQMLVIRGDSGHPGERS